MIKQYILILCMCLACSGCTKSISLRGMTKQQQTGALIGAVGGSLIGSQVGSGSGHIIGAAIGGVAGAVAGKIVAEELEETELPSI